MNKFCVPFKRNKTYNNEVKEFNIIYKDNIDQLKDFLTFVNPEQRVNIKIEGGLEKEIVDTFILIKAKHPETNFALAIKEYAFLGSQAWEDLKKANIPFYIDSFCDNLSAFQLLLNMGVSDILIGGDLGFSIKDVAEVAKSRNIAVRVICNLAQAPVGAVKDQITSFFIRPEDVDVYSEYVDTFEILDPKEDNYNIDVIYEVYANDKKWDGLLNEIILEYYLPTNSTYLIPSFVDRRLNCHKKCAFCKCNLCYELEKLSSTLEEKHLVIKADA